jgi:hypothetical protein
MDQFAKRNFDAVGDAGRATLCADLGDALTTRIRSESDFHGAVNKIITELRRLGHDLWSFDEAEEMEVWCPNYQEPTGPGIVVTFTPQHVTVEWSAQ